MTTPQDICDRVMKELPKSLIIDPASLALEALAALIGTVVGWLVTHCLNYIWPDKATRSKLVKAVRDRQLKFLIKHLARHSKYDYTPEQIEGVHYAFSQVYNKLTPDDVTSLKSIMQSQHQDGKFPGDSETGSISDQLFSNQSSEEVETTTEPDSSPEG